MLEPINSAFELENLLKDRFGVGQHGKKARTIGPNNNGPRMGSPSSFLNRDRPQRQGGIPAGSGSGPALASLPTAHAHPAAPGGSRTEETVLRQSSKGMGFLEYIGDGLKDAADVKAEQASPDVPAGDDVAATAAAQDHLSMDTENFAGGDISVPYLAGGSEEKDILDAAMNVAMQGLIKSEERRIKESEAEAEGDANLAADAVAVQHAPTAVHMVTNPPPAPPVADVSSAVGAAIATTTAALMAGGHAPPGAGGLPQGMQTTAGMMGLPQQFPFDPSQFDMSLSGMGQLPPSFNPSGKQEDPTSAAAAAAASAAAAAAAATTGDPNGMLDPSTASLIAAAANGMQGMQGLPPGMQALGAGGLPFPGLIPPGWGPILSNPLAWQLAGRLPMPQQPGGSNAAAAAAHFGLFPGMQLAGPAPTFNEQLAAFGIAAFNQPNAPGVAPAQEGGEGSKYSQGDRPGRPPSYDEMVKWCVNLKRCLWQRHVPLTIEEAVHMVNDPSLCVRPPALEGKSKVLVASTLRKRVLGIYRITWSQVASDSDPGLHEEISDASVLAAAAMKLKRHGMDPVRGNRGGAAGTAAMAAAAAAATGVIAPASPPAANTTVQIIDVTDALNNGGNNNNNGLPKDPPSGTAGGTAGDVVMGGRGIFPGQETSHHPLTNIPISLATTTVAGGTAAGVMPSITTAMDAGGGGGGVPGGAEIHGANATAAGGGNGGLISIEGQQQQQPDIILPLSSVHSNLPPRIYDLFDKGRSHFLGAEEVYEILTNAVCLGLPISTRPVERPTAGSMFLFRRSASPRFRYDGYDWKGRESHTKLKVGEEAKLNCYYLGNPEDSVQQRSYWLIDDSKNDLVLVHYQPPLAAKQLLNPGGVFLPEGMHNTIEGGAGSLIQVRRLSMQDRLGKSTTINTNGGFFVDNIEITTWNSANPTNLLYSYSTGFESVA